MDVAVLVAVAVFVAVAVTVGVLVGVAVGVALVTQVPGWPGRLHCANGPVQALLQHTSSAQKVDVHW